MTKRSPARVPPSSRHHKQAAPAAMAAKFQQALALHKQGQIDQAERLYREILAKLPAHFDALHMLGVIQRRKKEPAAALELIDRALAIDPANANAHNNRGNALRDLGRPEEALASFDRALALKPDYAEALNNRGYALKDLMRPEDALASYERALAAAPDHLDALNNRGVLLLELKRLDEALVSFERALALKADYAQAHINRANVLGAMNRPAEALQALDRALTINPNQVVALFNRGNVLQTLKRHADALESYERALALKPDHVEARNNRGRALLDLRRRQDALAAFDQVLALKPDHAHALNNRALALSELKRHEEAADAYARLVAVAPGYNYAMGNMLRAQLLCCDWRSHAQVVAQLVAAVGQGRNVTTPFAFLAASDSAAEQHQCSRIYVADRYPPSPAVAPSPRRAAHAKIRLAYLSADFHSHATAYLMAGLFEAHDRERFETTAISFGPDDRSEVRKRLQDAFHHFVDVSQRTDAETAQLLRDMEIDIAVDLKGFTTDCRPGILARRPAPLQVNYLGYPGTMGADYIDYIVADRHVLPAEHRPFYTEKVVYLPGSYQANDNTRVIADWTPTRAEAGLPQQGFVFCCFNNNYKITPAMFDIWMRLLKAVPGSVLWLLEDNPAVARNLRREADGRGVAAERLVFAPRLQVDRHLARQRLADLFVDTLPINAHTTASDALWAGLPLVTCMGGSFAGRVAGSLLHAAGLPELATHSLEEYEALACKLASTPDMLAELRTRLAQQRAAAPLFDTGRFCRNLEAAYLGMWQRHLRGIPPESFQVAE